MRPSALRLLALAALVLPAALPARAQQVEDRVKLAQTGLKFLSVAGDPRAAALGNAMTSLEGGSEMLFSNPAAMGFMTEESDVMLSQTSFIADINHNHASVAYRPQGGRLGVVGVSLAFVDYGDLQETIRADNDQGFVDVGTFSPSAFSLGLGYARAITDRFAVGGQVKYASQHLGASLAGLAESGGYERQEQRVGTFAYDFGVQYKTGFESLTFAVAARNFAPEVSFVEQSFQLPLTLQIGISMNVADLAAVNSNVHRFIVSADAQNPRDFAEQIRLGGEYTFLNTLALRAGYAFPADAEGVSFGAGIRQRLSGVGFGADYAYTDYGVFSGVHRIALRFAL